MSRVIGIDPSLHHIGLGLVQPGARLADRVLDARAIRVGDDLWGAVDRALEVVAGWAADGPIAAMGVEVYGEGGHGGSIAASVRAAKGPSWVGGILVGELRRQLGAPLEATASDWRPTMLSLAAREGRWLSRPGEAPQAPQVSAQAPQGATGAPQGPRVPRAPRVVFLTAQERAEGHPQTARALLYAPCGHRVVVADFQAVQAALAHSFACPRCVVAPAVPAAPQVVGAGPRGGRGKLTPEQRSEHWKEQAWRLVLHARPDLAQALYDDARARARKLQDPWRMEGVSDACDAVGVALHAAEAGEIGRGGEIRRAG